MLAFFHFPRALTVLSLCFNASQKSKGSWISLNRQELRKKEEELEAASADLSAKIRENGQTSSLPLFLFSFFFCSQTFPTFCLFFSLPEALHSKYQEAVTASKQKIGALEKRYKDLATELDLLKKTSAQQVEELNLEVRVQREKSARLERTVFEQKSDLEM